MGLASRFPSPLSPPRDGAIPWSEYHPALAVYSFWPPAWLTVSIAPPPSFAAAPAEKFALRDGDRVVLIGNTLIERAATYGYLETALTERYPERNIIFRNLGWSGDTVWGDARAQFGTAADGFRQLKDHVLALKPTVIFVGYGTNESFAGRPGLPHFLDGLKTLLAVLDRTKARIVILSPLRMENLGPPLPDVTEQNKRLAIYTAALRTVARERGDRFVDLFDTLAMGDRGTGRPQLTDDELHLTARGYSRFADQVMLDLFGPGSVARPAVETPQRRQLRQAIIHKNALYFRRWRPQNVTYLYLFRKGEQGNNAVEIPKFDPLIAAAEKQIAELRVAAARADKSTPMKEKAK